MATITGTNGDDTLTGTAGADAIYPLLGKNLINAAGGNDTIWSVGGSDSVNGGAGIDRWVGDYSASATGRTFTWNRETGAGTLSGGTSLASIEAVTLNTGSGADSVTINGTVDTVSARNAYVDTGNGNDAITLRGFGGYCHMSAGFGTDHVTFDLSNDTNGIGAGLSRSDEGFYCYVSDRLGSDFIYDVSRAEHVTLYCGSGDDGIGVSAVPLASGATVSIDGGAGTDFLFIDCVSGAPAGPTDVSFVVSGSGAITSSVGSFANFEVFRLWGSAGNDTLSVGNGDDTLNGGGGVDTLIGGAGNDTYVVDTTTDTITELFGGGTDTVESDVTFSLAALDHVENLTLTHANWAANNGTGNALANVLTGNHSNNVLSGLDGNDTLVGGGGADTLIGGDGKDTYTVNYANDIVSPDTIIELAGEGYDAVFSRVTFSLAGIDHVEKLTLTGTAAIDGTGNALNNRLTGTNAANRLVGDDGNDRLIGRGGADTLDGGAGSDKFTYAATGESTTAVRDTVLAFDGIGATPGDLSDLVAVDADVGMAGDQAFAFIGTAAFTAGVAGQLRVQASGADSLIQGETTGDGLADFEVLVQNAAAALWDATDFLL
jgi:trimeric autotransporter adhesin